MITNNKDYEIVDGKIVPSKNEQFQYGDRWVTCERCNTKRPVAQLRITSFDDVVCKDTVWCATHM